MIIHGGETTIFLLGRDVIITGVPDILDRMAEALYEHGCNAMIVYRESLGAAFFYLKTGYAGEVLQKFSNYDMRLAIIGGFAAEKSESLRAFIRESNRGSRVFFKESLAEGLAALGIKDAITL
jgi:hypothetical protein